MKTLIAYFSASGRTKKAAEQLARITGGELFEIRTKTPYHDSYFKKLKIGRAEMNCGSRSCVASARLSITFQQRQRARTMNGQICMRTLQGQPKQRTFPSLRRSSEQSAQSKSTTRSVTVRCFTTSKRRRYSKRARSRYGNAATAVIS